MDRIYQILWLIVDSECTLLLYQRTEKGLMGIPMSNQALIPKSDHALGTLHITLSARTPLFQLVLCKMPTVLRREPLSHALLLSRELSFHDSFACHSLYFLNQSSSSVQSLNIITATNTPATDKHIRHRSSSGAFRKSIL